MCYIANCAIMNLEETTQPQIEPKNVLGEITKLYEEILYEEILLKKYNNELDYNLSDIMSYISKIEHFLNFIKTNIDNIDAEHNKRNLNQLFNLYRLQYNEIKQKYIISK
jgi:hypothetical protein